MRYTFNVQTLSTIAVISLVLCAQSSDAQDHYSLEDSSTVYRLDNHVEVFLDSSNVIEIGEIAKPDFQQRFKSSRGLTFGYTKSSVWLKVRTKTNSQTVQWYLDIPAPYL